jgi:anti-sigma factor RsiW
MPDTYSSSDSPDELIESFLDDMLEPAERERVLRSVASDPAFAEQVALARSIRDALHTMPSGRAPMDMVPDVMRAVRREVRSDARDKILGWISAVGHVDFRPALATASLVALIVVAGVLGRPQPPAASPEALAALEQIKWTFALVSEVGEKTAMHLREDVLEPHVVGHMRLAVRDVFEDPGAGSRPN